MKAPFPYFGGKTKIAPEVWARFGRVRHYIEPFCGSAAMLWAAPEPASLEVVNDVDMYIANFWRCVKYQPEKTWLESDYPVSHVDLSARHRWLTRKERRRQLAENLEDPEWPGDARIAGWWAWGKCAWIGSGWCERESPGAQIPHIGDAGRGLQSIGVKSKIPHIGDAGRGLSAWQEGARAWLHALSQRMERVRVFHGTWKRCLNHHYGGVSGTALFLDPPYKRYERLYGAAAPVAIEVEAWARENAALKIALCGHGGDYDLPGWEVMPWSRGRLTYGGGNTTDKECVWFSPACEQVEERKAA